ncbi:pirin family protein [Anaerotalea alkaliphila]|uniref:Pirin family protein n=1 Tax=Anaerotalea alkaliphila TaxID=2662126 RepID=A0A7X5HXF4_9FIRM|nr:pirin family protein [Anaerotalea alkaliphila]NDL68261.1 pirin family protein [Anaerotalea alkaliphila]
MPKHPIRKVTKLGFLWETENPFLFCAHHKDRYPKGNGEQGPAASLAGRNLGNDFTLRDGWRMYHGDRVPGFPEHPHRGFETVTMVLEGFVDHSDSAGAAGRYGNGDVQWMTAGSGMQHAEMFPLVRQDKENPLELFQVWLNLPKKDKFTPPFYKMLWAEEIPVVEVGEEGGPRSRVRVIAGSFQGTDSLEPAPASWANDPAGGVRILILDMDPRAVLSLPKGSDTLSRVLYFHEGETLHVQDQAVSAAHGIHLAPGGEVLLTNGPIPSRLLLLEGEPILEPVVQYGPFVMNTEEEIQQAFLDYRQTRFGGWPWERPDPVHGTGENRFASHEDGSREERGPVGKEGPI